MGKIATATVTGVRGNLSIHVPAAVESFFELTPGKQIAFNTEPPKKGSFLTITDNGEAQ